MNRYHDPFRLSDRGPMRFMPPGHSPRPAHAPQPPRHQPPKAHHGQRHQPHVVNDSQTVHISADRLRHWKAQLDYIEPLRDAIKSISMSSSERTKLLALTTQLKGVVGGVKNEISQKLRA